MSISMISSTITRLHKEIADIVYRISLETRKETDLTAKIVQIQSSLSRTTSPSALQSKLNDMSRKQQEIAKIQAKKADLSKKESEINGKLLKEKQALAKAEDAERKKQSLADERERKRILDLEKKQQREQIDHQRKLKAELEGMARTTQLIKGRSLDNVERQVIVNYDLFISHASEDKEDFVRPLAEALIELGVKVWYDEFTLRVGDSLRERIDHGLANSRYGTLVISESFIKKQWTSYEFNGLVAREMNGHKMILPIWHKISKNEVLAYSPSLADKVALNTSLLSIEEIAHELANLILER